MDSLNEHEAFIRERLADPSSTKAEVLAWLSASPRNTLGELGSNEESVRLAHQVYAAGAAEVLAIEINACGDIENSGKLLIKLPDHPLQRKSVFAWHGAQAESIGYDPEEDIGQTYLFSMLD